MILVPRNGFAGQRGQRGAPADPFMEMERMKRMMGALHEQLAFADDTIRKLKNGDMQNGVMMGGRFENVSQGGTRPSQIIEQYGQLYSQGRLNAMDDLDQIAGLSKYGKHTEMKQKILYGIMVVSSIKALFNNQSESSFFTYMLLLFVYRNESNMIIFMEV